MIKNDQKILPTPRGWVLPRARYAAGAQHPRLRPVTAEKILMSVQNPKKQ